MHLATKAIVINKIRYKEKGLIVKLFTEERGMLSFIIRSAHSKKNKLSALYQPLTILNIQALVKENSSLHYIKEARVEDPLNNIHQNPIKLGVSMFVAEIMYKTLREEEPNPALYHFLTYALHWLELSQKVTNFPIAFLVNLSTYYGFPPNPDVKADNSYFDLREGEFVRSKPVIHPEFLSIEKSRYLHLFLGANFDESSSINMSSEMRKELLNQMVNYFQIHLDQLRNIQSHHVLEETFNEY
ncbi:MAG: DNA repair protein RecO (recombination protein O) [Glaciecola sp.]|jgi:DNA repair protein RecO (recombination protein O)